MSPRLMSVILFSLFLYWNNSPAPQCARVKSNPDAWVAAKTDALVLAAHAAYEDDDRAGPAYGKVVSRIADTIEQCKLAQNNAFAGRYAEFVEYVEAASLDQRPEHELGFTVSDRQYFEETRTLVQIPEFLTDQGFLRSVSRYETLERAKTFLRQLNSTRGPADQLVFFSYKSRHLGTPDNDASYRRLLVVVPGDASSGVPDKWVQFGVTDPGARARVRNVSVVSTLAGEDGTSNVYFKDFYRTYRRGGSITIKGRWELGYGDDNCVQCHKSGVLPVFPVDESVRADERRAVEVVNARFRSYGWPRFAGYLDETKFGPGLGSANLAERERRFGSGFGETTVARSMTCTACHRPEGLGYFNWPMDKTVISSFIKGGQMPLGSKLGKVERGELYEKLIQEYFDTSDARPGILKSWLLGRLR